MAEQPSPLPVNDDPDQATTEIAPESQGDRARQLLGMKGAKTGETSIWKIRLQLMKPITWIPLIWGVVCGAASSGNYRWSLEYVLIAAACMLMSGPLLTGYTQTLTTSTIATLTPSTSPTDRFPLGPFRSPRWWPRFWCCWWRA
jgi:chlorophyll synthase